MGMPHSGISPLLRNFGLIVRHVTNKFVPHETLQYFYLSEEARPKSKLGEGKNKQANIRERKCCVAAFTNIESPTLSRQALLPV